MCALGVVGLASASAALPEFEVTGKYPVTFTGKSGAVHIREKNLGGSYTCTSSSITGEITGPKELGEVFIKFAGSEGCGGFCQQKSSPYPEWETKELKGRIAYLNKGEKRVGLLLEPVAEPVAKCNPPVGQAIEKVEGSILGGLIRQTSKVFVLNYAQSGGQQAFDPFRRRRSDT